MNLRIFGLVAGIVFLLSGWGCGSRKDEATDQQKPAVEKASLPRELQELNAGIQKDSTNATLYYKRACYFLNKREFNASLLDMSKVMRLDSMKPAYYITISDIYLYGNHTSKSKDALEKCLSIEPENTEALIKLAQLYFFVKKYQESINCINSALKVDAHIAKGYFLKGLDYKEGGDTAKAISNLVTATEQDPEYFSAFEELGVIYAAKKNKLAVSYFDNALALEPANADLLYSKSKFYQDIRDWDDAISNYQDLLKKVPGYKHAYFNLGAVYLAGKKNYDEAIRQFTEAIKIDSRYSDAYFARGTSYAQKGDNVSAKADYQKCLQLDPNYQAAEEALKELP